MKIEDIRAKKDAGIKEEIVNLRKESFNIRFQATKAEMKNTALRRIMRRDIAKMKTVLRERSIAKEGAK